jgi:hypothetical protein
MGVFGSVKEVAGKPWDSTFSGKVELLALIEQSTWPGFGFADDKKQGGLKD